ncbi:MULTISPECIES: DMT family transporter [unclassified Pseudomonas]|uniref:DMT family transporter n=1 Tax=unclassified Pseudomonas TaxID=196821 RepID=UPI001294D4BB|nr:MULTISPECIES: DMT family transporter [unclassified Pseudomonas]MQT41063.1 EamA family transporter [Pseudomonas sp. FSL R10-0765]MQT53072.1 EamA family transporter [Pseudomonas sp. FSL R10-2398]MQT99277.1 EamA family transporter [Pseudomonas sp. FSL R10-2245]MQU12967.1 EamA family transporter [Pseudomonas sp. FSL R10-2189]MQU39121.1 EamA family transporter [Pseudomonas sp. FSL R10-2172]
MSLTVFEIVLVAAVLHASWNAIVKAGKNTVLTMVLVTASAALWAVVLLPVLPSPSPESWPYIALSAALQIVYFALVARIYRIADMSQTYPIMRGAAPLIVALAGTLLLDEALSSSAWLGVCIICSGILIMLWSGGQKSREGLILALLNALVISGYTLVDGIGVRLSAASASYTLWIFLITGVAITCWATLTQWSQTRHYLRLNWHLGAVGGLGTLVSYGLALYAMTQAPVAVVAALRETSILFSAVISWLILKEHITIVRCVSVCVIAIGAITLRLA